MPMYDFHCDQCGHNFEDLCPADAEQAPPCEKCGAADTHRTPSIPVARVNDEPKKNPRLPSSFGSSGSSLGRNPHF